MATVRRFYMRLTNLSIRWGDRPAYIRMLYWFWSWIYDATVGWDPAFRDNAERMVRATVHPGEQVLDVGVGTGLLAEYGAPTARDYRGIDISGAMLSRAARKIARMHLVNATLQWGSATSLPYEDATFDAVVSSFMLPHIARPERTTVLTEMGRVLRPGGRLGLYLAQGEIAPIFPTRSELDQDLARARFQNCRVEDCDDVYRIVTATAPQQTP